MNIRICFTNPIRQNVNFVVSEAHTCAVVEWSSNGDGTHDGICDCTDATVVTDNEACDTDGEDGACSKCGYKAECAHSWGELEYKVEDTTCITYKSCSLCGETETVHSVASKTITPNPVTSSGLAIRFRTKTNTLTGYTDIFAKISKDVYSVDTLTGKSDPITITAVTQGTNQQMEYTDLVSYEMSSKVYVEEYGTYTDGNVVLIGYTEFTFTDYFKSKIADTSGAYNDAYKNFFADALRYGAASQTYMQYNRNNLPTDGFETTYGTELPTTFTNTEITATGSVTLEPNVALGNSFVFRPRFLKSSVSDVDEANLKLTVDYTNAYAQATQDVGTISDFTSKSSNTKWQYDFANLPCAYINDYFTVKVWDGDTVIGTLEYCFQAYAADKYAAVASGGDANLATLCQATVAYGNSAATAFLG